LKSKMFRVVFKVSCETTGTSGENMRKILVIEDNLVNSYLIESILNKKGYTVIQTTHAGTGIELAAKEAPELIIVDLHIADINGLEAVRKINLLAPRIPLIALTSYAITNEKEKALDAGCTACIEKPINPDIFAEQLERYLS
jgi:two-component system cell cycle response regulator DivK